jgi:hypothetical protein
MSKESAEENICRSIETCDTLVRDRKITKFSEADAGSAGKHAHRLFFDIGILPVGTACNLNCKSCFWPLHQRHKSEFMKVSDELFTHLQRIGVTQCFIGGGEPSLHPNIRKMLYELSKRFSIRYLLSNGRDLQKYRGLIHETVGFLAISIDRMHKEAVTKGNKGDDYPYGILSAIKLFDIHDRIRINSVVSGHGDLPFLLNLRDEISFIEKIKNWHIYPEIPKKISEVECYKIVDVINISSPLNFKVKYLVPNPNFLQLLIFPDYSIESLSCDSSGHVKKRIIENIFDFGSLNELVQYSSKLHSINADIYCQWESNDDGY